MALVTPESVNAACEAIAARGERPTAERVRLELGGGSPNTVLILLNAWKDARKAGGAKRQAPEPPPAPDGDVVTPEAVNAVDNISRGILAMLTSVIEQERARASAAQQAIQAAADQKVALARQAADEQVADLQKQAAEELDDARAEALEMADLVEALTTERDALAGSLDSSRAEVGRLKAELEAERQAHQQASALAGERAAEIEALRQTVAQAEARAVAAEREQRAAQDRADVAEKAQEHAEEARDKADAERRQVGAEAKAKADEAAEHIHKLTTEWEQVREALASEKAKGEALVSRLAEVQADRDLAHQIRAEAQSAAVEARSTLDQALRRAAEAEAVAVRAGADVEKWREKAVERAEEIKELHALLAAAGKPKDKQG